MADIQGYIFLFLIWLIPTVLLRVLFRNRKLSRLPPSPLAFPIIGHLHLLAPIPHQALHRVSNRYGPLLHLFLGSVPCVVASSPEMAKVFLKTHENSFSNRPNSAVVDYITYGSQDFSFAPYGPYWKFMKKLCMTELLGGRTLDLLLPVRRDEITRFMELLSRKSKAGEAVDVGAELIRLANNVVSRMAMSRRCSENENEAADIKTIIHEIAELTGKFNVSDFIWFCKNLDLQGFKKRIRDVAERFDVMIEKIIEEHQETRTKRRHNNDAGQQMKDLLDILLDISEDESSDIRLTRENIKAFILDIFAAGTDTSAITLEWALSELINHPHIMQKAVQEIDSNIGKNRLIDESDISKLPYLQAIVKETLRLHPTGPMIVRESSEDCEVAGYHIPAKTRLLVNVWAIGRDPNYWENPLEFRPERFVFEEGNVSNSQPDVRGQHFHLLPFGSGRRGCPGTSLALQVVQTSLAAMLQCFEWNVNGEGNGKVDMEEGPGITLPKARPLVCVPKARFNPLPI
ncbi:cytochrome P450 93A3-like [Coffea eugenioides]|uniref:3,9-dihydroxypterocarpan 6A-monooxygenase-like n=1 Tax=Coffea arabica TaxID=13443 RepID=A0A6P6SX64_COFAR|nr:cytochrome P450 93A3-like [Coffea arabica]XP_027176876.1 cytochrome P450 93A3-like [Coffea eugenioides]